MVVNDLASQVILHWKVWSGEVIINVGDLRDMFHECRLAGVHLDKDVARLISFDKLNY